MAKILEHGNENQERLQDKNKRNADVYRRPSINIKVGDEVLVNTHIQSNANKGLSAKFVPRRGGPYIVIGKEGAISYVIASKDNPYTPRGTHHVRDLTLYKGSAYNPIYPIRRRGRPSKKQENININSATSKESPKSSATQQETITPNEAAIKEKESSLRRSKRIQDMNDRKLS